MKKIILGILLFFIFISVKGLDIKSNNAILYNMNDNKIIYEKNAYDKVQIASLTKIVTAITYIITNITYVRKGNNYVNNQIIIYLVALIILITMRFSS